MLPVIRTERLLLQPWTSEDAQALRQLFDNPDVRRYLFDDMAVSLERTQSILEMHLALQESRGIGYWAVLFNDAMIGFAGISGEDGEVELMYALLPDHWGHGYATEAAKAVIDYACTAGYSKIIARTDPPNERSVRVMERLGMQRRDIESGPEGQPLFVYSLWRKTHATESATRREDLPSLQAPTFRWRSTALCRSD